MAEEIKSELDEKLRRFFEEELKPYFNKKGGDKVGILMIAIEQVSDKDCQSAAMVLGKRKFIVPGITKVMQQNESIREIIQHSNKFYDFLVEKEVAMELIGAANQNQIQ